MILMRLGGVLVYKEEYFILHIFIPGGRAAEKVCP
jgi:hypothetical protein